MPTNRVLTNPNKPGVIFVPELGEEFLLSKEREGAFYDTVEQASGSIGASASLTLFQNFTNKFEQHVNVGKNGKLPSGNAQAMLRTGVVILQANANTVATDDDILKVSYGGVLDFKVNERVIVKKEPLYTLPSGYGMAGMTTRNATGIVTTGIPSAAAAPVLRNAQPVLDRDDLNAQVIFPDNIWITGGTTRIVTTNATYFQHILWGVVKQPVGN